MNPKKQVSLWNPGRIHPTHSDPQTTGRQAVSEQEN
jgi:hypothetical protein